MGGRRTRRRGFCRVCSRRVNLRADGSLGKHQVKVYDGWGGRLRSIIGTVYCAGTGRSPDDPELYSIPQTCGWCGRSREDLSHDCKRPRPQETRP